MDALKLAAVCFIAGPPASYAANTEAIRHPPTHLHLTLDQWQPLIDEAATRFGIPADWIKGVMRLESGGHETLDGVPTTSSAGAMGLMQLMPATYAHLRVRHGLGKNPYDPRDNILAGAAYLSEMYRRYGYPNLFAAYHAGPGRLDAFRLTKRPLPEATIAYLNALSPTTGDALASSNFANPQPQNALFYPLHTVESHTTSTVLNDPKSSSLFVPLTTTHP